MAPRQSPRWFSRMCSISVIISVNTPKELAKVSGCESVDFCYWDFPLIELAGRTMGLIGLGRIGQATAALALAFGMKVIAYDAIMKESPLEGVQLVLLDELFQQSDVISLHCPLTADTEKMINAQRLKTMKPKAFLINTGRGPLIDETALAEALNSGLIAGRDSM